MLLRTFSNNKKDVKRNMSIYRIVILGMFLSLLISFKWIFGFVPGVEIVSFLFIIFGIVLPIADLMLLIISFNLLVLVIYGFGGWWVMYWVIWPFDAFISKGLSKITKNKYIFSLFGFIAGMLVAFWYFISDAIFFDQTFATMNLVTAIPINAIEGFTTFFMIIAIAPKLLTVITAKSFKIWGIKKKFKFRRVKYFKVNIIISIFLAITSLISIVLLFVYNTFFIDWKNKLIGEQVHSGHVDKEPNVPWGHLSVSEYNDIYDELHDQEIGIVLIHNHLKEKEIISFKNGDKAWDIMQKSNKWDFKLCNNNFLGVFVNSFAIKGSNNYEHGTSQAKNYGDYYPMFLYNHQYMNLGVSNLEMHSKDILEITYDF